MEYTKIAQFHKEVNAFCKYICPTPREYDLRGQVINRIEKVLKRRWPQTVVQPFGSYVTRLCLTNSSIDVSIIGKWTKLPLTEITRELLDEDIVDETHLKYCDGVPHPVIEMIDRLTEMKVRIYFDRKEGIKSTRLTRSFIKLYPALPKLICIMKQFLHQRGLGNPFNGGLTSFSLTLMCISFMQMHRQFTGDDVNLGELLIEFLHFYGETFNYFTTGISIHNGGKYIPKEELLRNMVYRPRPSVLCIQDPIEPRINVGRFCFGILEIQRMFKEAHIVIMDSLKPKKRIKGLIIGKIVCMGARMLEYRKWLEEVCCK